MTDSIQVLSDPKEIRSKLKELSPGRADMSFNEDDETVKLKKNKDLIQVVSGLPTVPSLDEMKSMAKMVNIIWTEGMENRYVQYIASDERVDGMGDIVRQNWDFSVFRYNSAMPLGHRWEMPPIGKYINWKTITIADNNGYNGPALYLSGFFGPSGISATIDEVANLVLLGFMTSCSVGFEAKEVIIVNDPDERAKLGLGRWGVIFNKNLLLENSPVTIPANEGAHKLSSLQKGAFKERDFHILADLYRLNVERGKDDSNTWEQIEADLLLASKNLFKTLNYSHVELDAPVFSSINQPIVPKMESTITTFTMGSTFYSAEEKEILKTEIKDLLKLEIGVLSSAIIEKVVALIAEDVKSLNEFGDKLKDVEELILDLQDKKTRDTTSPIPGSIGASPAELKDWEEKLTSILSRGLR